MTDTGFTSRSTLGADDLVLCGSTLIATPVEERIEIAAAHGFRGVGLRSVDCRRVWNKGSVAEVRARLAHHGLEVGELDGMTQWAPRHQTLTSVTGQRAEGLADRMAALWWFAEEVGARTVNVIEMESETGSTEEMAEAFAALCDRAAEVGMFVQLEPLPWTGIPDLASAAAITRMAGRVNGGVCLDTWHLLRAGQGPEDLTTDLTDTVVGIQVSDAPATPSDNLLHETQHERLLPGQGAARVAEVLQRLRDAGVQAPVGVEVMSDRLTAMPPAEAAAVAAEATRAVLPRSS